MLFNLVLVISTFGAVLSAYNGPLAGGVPAHQYPAGISPEACPNFPNCDNPSVAADPNTPIQKYQLVNNNKQAFQPSYQQNVAAAPAYQTYENGHNYQAPANNHGPVYQTESVPVQHQSAYRAAPISNVPYPNNYVQTPQKQVSRNDPEFTGAYAPKDALDAGEYGGDGDYRGEGLNESGAYEQQQQQNQQGHQFYQQVKAVQHQPQAVQHQPIYQQQGYEPQITRHSPGPVPAGLDPNACPNYPYCH